MPVSAAWNGKLFKPYRALKGSWMEVDGLLGLDDLLKRAGTPSSSRASPDGCRLGDDDFDPRQQGCNRPPFSSQEPWSCAAPSIE
jgi:hypothetical protein